MSRQSVKVKRTCPYCQGTGKPTGDKSVGEMLSGFCSKCNGSGQVSEYIDIPETRTNSSSSSSSSGGADYSVLVYLALLALALVAIFYLLLIALLISPIIFGGWLIFFGWWDRSVWLKIGWAFSWIIVYLLSEVGVFDNLNFLNSLVSYIYIGFGALAIVIGEVILRRILIDKVS